MMCKKYPAFLESEIKNKLPRNALFHIIPVPFERTTSYKKGTKKGPSAILKASQQLELFNESANPAKVGIYTHKPIKTFSSTKKVLSSIENRVKESIIFNKIPILLGGEHTITLGAIEAIKKIIGNFGVIHFDAHSDLRNSYDKTTYSHACIARRIHELNIDIFQIGVRSLSEEEHIYRKEKKIKHCDAEKIHSLSSLTSVLPKSFPKRVYITVDMDVFDPSIIPATGTPEPGGLSWFQMNELLKSITKRFDILGFDMVELSTIRGFHHCEYSIAKLIYIMMGMISKKLF